MSLNRERQSLRAENAQDLEHARTYSQLLFRLRRTTATNSLINNLNRNDSSLGKQRFSNLTASVALAECVKNSLFPKNGLSFIDVLAIELKSAKNDHFI